MTSHFKNIIQRLGSAMLLGLCYVWIVFAAVSAAAAIAANPTQDAYASVIAELYEDEVAEFEALYADLTPAGRDVFARIVARLETGQRGTMGLLIARAPDEPANQFLALFGSLSEEDFGKAADELSQKTYSQWNAVITVLGAESLANVRREFAADDTELCAAFEPDETDSATPPRCSLAIEQFRAAFRPSSNYVTNGFRVGANGAPYQAQLSLFGPSTAAYRDADARSKQVKQFGRALKDWEINHTCGAVYIGEKFVLTAAHCVVSSLSDARFFAGRRIRLGSHRIDNLSNLGKIRSVITHSDYNSRTLQNDIALIELEEAPRISRVRSVKLPQSANFLPRPGQIFLTGWGYIRPTLSSGNARALDGQFQLRAAPDLRGGVLQIYSAQTCTNNQTFRRNKVRIRAGQLCAGTANGTGSCRGDSGGPLVDTKTNTLIGLVSGGKGCGLRKTPSVYVDVAYYIDWIDGAKRIARNSSGRLRTTYR